MTIVIDHPNLSVPILPLKFIASNQSIFAFPGKEAGSSASKQGGIFEVGFRASLDSEFQFQIARFMRWPDFLLSHFEIDRM